MFANIKTVCIFVEQKQNKMKKSTLISLRQKLTIRLMSIPYDTTDLVLVSEMKSLISQIEAVNKELKKM